MKKKDREGLLAQNREDAWWAAEDKELNAQHAGEIVAIHRKKVLAAGRDWDQVVADAEKQGFSDEEFVVVVVPSFDYDVSPDLN